MALLIILILITGCNTETTLNECWVTNEVVGRYVKGISSNINDAKLGEINNCCCVSVNRRTEFICYCNENKNQMVKNE